MSDASNPISEAIKDRLKSNVFGSLVISFFSWHWRVFIFVFTGEHSAEARVGFVERYFNSFNPFEFFIFPFLITLGYLFILPFLTDLYEHVPRKFKQRKDVLDKESEAISESIVLYGKSIYSLAERLRIQLLETAKLLADLEQHLDNPSHPKAIQRSKAAIANYKEKFNREIEPVLKLSFSKLGNLEGHDAVLTFIKSKAELLQKIRFIQDPQ